MLVIFSLYIIMYNPVLEKVVKAKKNNAIGYNVRGTIPKFESHTHMQGRFEYTGGNMVVFYPNKSNNVYAFNYRNGYGVLFNRLKKNSNGEPVSRGNVRMDPKRAFIYSK